MVSGSSVTSRRPPGGRLAAGLIALLVLTAAPARAETDVHAPAERRLR